MEGERDKEVERRGQGVILTDPLLREMGIGDEAVDQSPRSCLGRQERDPVDQAVSAPEMPDDIQEEAAVNGVVGFGKVTKEGVALKLSRSIDA